MFFSSSYSYNDNNTSDDSIEVRVEISPASNSKTKAVKRIIKYDSNGLKKITENRTKTDTIIINKQKLITEVIEEMTSFEDGIEEQLSESHLDSVITNELNTFGIDTNFDFGVFDKDSWQFVIIKTGSDKDLLKKSKFQIAMSPNNIFAQPFNFAYLYPE